MELDRHAAIQSERPLAMGQDNLGPLAQPQPQLKLGRRHLLRRAQHPPLPLTVGLEICPQTFQADLNNGEPLPQTGQGIKGHRRRGSAEARAIKRARGQARGPDP